jgi:cobalt-zinc-cadmium efflux system membrane fusion protein
MKLCQLAVVVIIAFTVGCTRNDSKRAADEAPAPAPSTAPPREHGAKGFLHIEPEMLRDLKITTAPVEQRPGGEGAMLLGELRVNEDAYAEVGAPVPSRILALHAALGHMVESGEALATLQSTELGKARSDLITASSRLQLAKQTLERKRRLAGERIVSQRELQEAEANVTSAEADVHAARAALRSLGVGADTDQSSDSSQYVLRSPVKGSVLERTAVTGQLAEPSRPLFRIGDLSELWLTVQAFERDAVRIKVGAAVRTTFAALPGRTFSGKVALIGKEVNSQSRTISVRVEVANREGLLRPGMSATAWITPGLGAPTILAVPAAALQRVEDEWVVFIPQGQDRFAIRGVGRGRDLAGEVEILSGLKPAETVVVEGSFLLKAESDKARGEGEEHEH